MNPRSRRPLIYWCRWHSALLQIRGKDGEALEGELLYPDGRLERFRFHPRTWQLTRQTEAGEISVTLDEMGTETEGGDRDRGERQKGEGA
jgi:hypothetical protein